jgi:rSAM/selenodomain-associated transferase 2
VDQRISVVMPALDEEAWIESALASVAGDADELIVVDGGSTDGTVERARRAGARVLEASGGRGPQLDCGARSAQGEWLLFLHADTRLDAGWASDLRGLPSHFVGGAFRFAVESPRSAFRVIEAGVRLRCELLRLPYGDQALFARREAYAACGGFPPLPLMEDVAFVRRLRRIGPLAFPKTRARTSARRWERRGLLRTTLANLRLLSLYLAGRAPERLAAEYQREAS